MCVLAYSLLTLKLMLLTPAYTIKKAYGSVKLKAYYGAQNEAYMSRSAEKLVRGLCFNELGVGG